MFEFDLQRFDDEQAAGTSPETLAEETPIPEELGGLGEDYAREAMNEWEETKEDAPPEEVNVISNTVSREDYQAKLNEIEQLKAQLAQRQNQSAPQPAQSQAFQPPQMKITPESSTKLKEAVKAEAMNMTGFSEDDVASLDYADDDDPRLEQWAQAKRIAEYNVFRALNQTKIEQDNAARYFFNVQTEAKKYYDDFTAKAQSEKDYGKIVDFAAKEYLPTLSPLAQSTVGLAYQKVQRNMATPTEYMAVVNFYDAARNAYRSGRGRKNSYQNKSAGLPRIDQISGGAGKGEVTVGELEHMLDTTDFDKIPEAYRKKLLGY